MQTPVPKAWFLGPKAENQEYFERMLLEAFRDYCYWRRNFHPEDQACVRAADRLQPEFLQYQESLHDQLFEMLSQLKRSMPFFSPRYLGHMAKDLLTPGLLGYLAAMFYNQNNVTREAATITTGFEAEALRGLAAMLGYDPERAWGHLCSGGTLANIEALWVARNARLMPFQLALARDRAPSRLLPLLDELLADSGSLSRLPMQQLPVLQARIAALSQQQPELGELLAACSVSRLGLAGFQTACQRAGLGLPARLRVAYSQNAHYSLRKCLGLLGLGEDAALLLPLDERLRLDADALERAMLALPEDEALLAVVGVYGSTEEGAIDDFDRLVALRDAHGFWLHGDACYGGYALALRAREPEADPVASLQAYLQGSAQAGWDAGQCRRWLRVSEALGRCDSIALDPHKLGYLPYPAGAVLYREASLREFIRCEAPYLNDSKGPDDSAGPAHQAGPSDPAGLAAEAGPAGSEGRHWQTPYPGHYTLEGSRPGAASAAVWLAHRTVPLDRSGHGLLVSGSLAGAAYLQQLLQEQIPRLLPGLVCRFLCEAPDLNLLCYSFSGHWQGRPLSLSQSNRAVEALYQALLRREDQASGDFIVSMTRLEAAAYGQERLAAIWRRLAPAAGEADVSQVALLRTVVMDPFLPAAMTRRPDGRVEPLAERFVQILAAQLSRILAETGPGAESLAAEAHNFRLNHQNKSWKYF